MVIRNGRSHCRSGPPAKVDRCLAWCERFCTDADSQGAHAPIKPLSQGGSAPKSVKWRGAMDDARRYRVNAADCLLAAKSCQSGYRAIILSVSACWHSLAIEEEAIDLLRTFAASRTTMVSASRERQ
jgi:hypothetical protein